MGSTHTQSKQINLCIVSYTFPPSPGVGGRRWVKHAKYLARQGYRVRVIAAKPYEGDRSSWDEDLEGLEVHYLPRRYPKALDRPPHHLLGRLGFRFWSWVLPLFIRGSIYDRALFWRKPLQKKLNHWIECEGLTHIICTGAPFRVLSYVSELKTKFPDLTVLSDLRDPWLGSHAYGLRSLKPNDRAHEAALEQQVVCRSDWITVPVEPMKQDLQTRYPEHKGKIIVLPHGFDPDEITAESAPAGEIQRWVLYGSLYDGLEDTFKELAKCLSECQGKVKLDVFSANTKYKSIFENCGAKEHVQYHDPLPTKALFAKFSSYHAALLIHPDYGKDHLSTKIYEVIASKTPILFFGNNGKVGTFVMDTRTGVHLPLTGFESQLISIVQGKFKLHSEPTFDISAFSFEKLTENLLEILFKP